MSNVTIKKAFWGYIFMIVISWGFKFIAEIMTITIKYKQMGRILSSYSSRLITYTSPTILMASVFLILLFKQLLLKLWLKKVVIALSPLAFSVYLIHVHPLVWQNLGGKFVWVIDLPIIMFIIVIIGIALGIYVGCLFLDIIRQQLFDFLNVKIQIQKLETYIENRIIYRRKLI